MKKINEVLCEIVTNKELFKDIYTGIGYFVFTAGLLRIFINPLPAVSWYLRLLCILSTFILLSFASVFWLIYVIRPIIKITWADFGIPCMDSIEKIPIKILIKRLDFWVFSLFGFLSIRFGFYLVEIITKAAI